MVHVGRLKKEVSMHKGWRRMVCVPCVHGGAHGRKVIEGFPHLIAFLDLVRVRIKPSFWQRTCLKPLSGIFYQ